MKNIKTEKILETIYQNLIEKLPDTLCETCPVVISLRSIMISMKRQNNEEIASDLGIDLMDFSCPFCSKSNDQ